MKTWLKDGKTLKKRFGAGLAVAHGFGGASSAVHYSMEKKTICSSKYLDAFCSLIWPVLNIYAEE